MPFGTRAPRRAPATKKAMQAAEAKNISSTTRLISNGVPARKMGSQMNSSSTCSSIRSAPRAGGRTAGHGKGARRFPGDQTQVGPDQREPRHRKGHELGALEGEGYCGEHPETTPEGKHSGAHQEARVFAGPPADHASGEPQVGEGHGHSDGRRERRLPSPGHPRRRDHQGSKPAASASHPPYHLELDQSPFLCAV